MYPKLASQKNHWITVLLTLGCSPSTINLYDSIQHLELSNKLWQISCNEIIAYEKEGSVCST